MKSAERLIYKAIHSSVVSIEEILHSEKNLNPTIKKKNLWKFYHWEVIELPFGQANEDISFYL
jgi:hypothetical protein